ncbi:MAG: hypothetical protein WCP61_09130 [Chitinophagia bacterium]
MFLNNIISEILTIQTQRNVIILALCGSADTGKTTLAERICDELNKIQIKSDHLSTDSFLIDREERNIKGISGYNLAALKSNELLDAVEILEQGNGLTYYPYDNKSGKNVSECRLIKESNVIIIEGIHSFNEIIRNKIDLKIYIDAERDVLKKLRFKANINKRDFSEKEAGEKIDKEIEEFNKYILPNRKHSDLIIEITEKYNYKIK